MPSGKTHDAITFLLAVPAFVGTYVLTRSLPSSAIVVAVFVFGGLMFGPDLDTVSRQYSRWSAFRFIWFPYRKFFKHRSRFSHGLIFGALIRVIYFMGVMTLLAFAAAYVFETYTGGRLPGLMEFVNVWRAVGDVARARFGEYSLAFVFVGLWSGAASHTFTDLAGSFIKTGRIARLF